MTEWLQDPKLLWMIGLTLAGVVLAGVRWWFNHSHKHAQLDDRVAEIGGDIKEFKTEVKADIKEFKTDVKADIVDFKTEVRADIVDFKTEVRADITDFKTEVRADIADFKTEVRADIVDFKTEIADFKTEFVDFKTEVKADIKELGADVKALVGRLSAVANADSPLHLNALGKEVSSYINAKDIAKQEAPKVVARLPSRNPYDIQTYCMRHFSDDGAFKPTAEQLDTFKRCAYDHGIKLELVQEVCAYELRDELHRLIDNEAA